MRSGSFEDSPFTAKSLSATLAQHEISLFRGYIRQELQKMFLPHPRVKVSIVGSLRDREVACFQNPFTKFQNSLHRRSSVESPWRTVSSQSSQ